MKNPEIEHRAADVVIAALSARIASNDLAHGTMLPPERDLMTQFKASRTVIREAISALTARGLLEAKPRHRPVVRQPDYGTFLSATDTVAKLLLTAPGGVKNLYDTRVFIERGLVRDAATNATKDDIAALKAALAANHAALGDNHAFDVTDVAFHAVLYTMSGNPIFTAMRQGFTQWLAPHWARMPRDLAHNTRAHADHIGIMNAILDRDPGAAEAALERHLDAAWQAVAPTLSADRD